MATSGYSTRSESLNAKALASSAPVVLTVAGSDSGGGAGIQADIKTCEALGVFACTAIVALTAQNTKGVHGVHPVPVDFIEAQVRAVVDDFDVSCVKTGMLPTQEIIDSVAKYLQNYPGGCPPYVLDPVMVAASKDPLINENAISNLKTKLFPLATIVTPNVHEASLLVGRQISTLSEMKGAAQEILKLGPKAVLVKGGRLAAETGDKNNDGAAAGEDCVVDIFVSAGEPSKCIQLVHRKVQTSNNHGTGCTLAASIAAELAKKQWRQKSPDHHVAKVDISSAVRSALGYVQSVLEASTNLVLSHGGHGPLNHQRSSAWRCQAQQEAATLPVALPPLRKENDPSGNVYGPNIQALWKAASPVLQAIQLHPFLAGLVDGNLDMCKFKQYVYQDKLYLERFSRGLALLASKGTPGTVGSLATFASTCEIVEKALHESFISTWEAESGNTGQLDIRSPACELYTSWLLAAAAAEPLPVALASFLPCFLVYLWIGKLLLSRRADHDEAFAKTCAGTGEPCVALRPDPYNKWIDTYAGPEFEGSVIKMLGIVDAAATESPGSTAAMAKAFRKGCEMEFGFWDSAWRLEEWRQFHG